MRILGYLLVVLFVTTSAFGQQINPVPDYIFRYQMSVGRNAPTDTAAYLSVGPRYGANKGLMPPMVVDTNAVTGVKRNGLLIFSVQLNNFAYWDSTTSRFRKITAEAVVDSVVFATRAWRKKGDDSLGAVISQRTDTALLSTKAYRQKGVDSLVTLISTLGGGTVLSVSAGTGMNFTTITTSGAVNADTNVLSTRANRDKLKDSINANVALKVNISDTSTMLAAYLRKADTTSMLSPYLRKTDTTAMLTPYVRIAGFGLTKGTQALSVDSALMATRARVQKGIDSVASLVTTTDSLLFSTRAWRQKGVDSVAALANTKATATGTTNYLSKFTGTSSLGNSIVYATTSEVGISTPSPTHPLDVNGRVRVRTIDSTATGMNMLYADVDGVVKKAAPPAGGTVTSVSAGTGMSFTTITTSGSVSADTVALATRAWRQKGIDSVANVRIGGSGTINRVAKFTASGTVGNGSIADSASSVVMTIMSNGNTGVGIVPTRRFHISGSTGYRTEGGGNDVQGIDLASPFYGGDYAGFYGYAGGGSSPNNPFGETTASSSQAVIWSKFAIPLKVGTTSTNPLQFYTASSERMRITAAGRLLVGTTTEGTNTVDIAGTLRSTQGANFATSSGNVGVGTTTPDPFSIGGKVLTVTGAFTRGRLQLQNSNGTEAGAIMGSLSYLNGTTSVGDITVGNTATSNVNGYMAFAVNGGLGLSERMRIDSAGRLGINTTSPTEIIDVNGRARVRTIDSTSSPINVLTSDVNGIIQKTSLAATGVQGSGTTNRVSKFTASGTIGNGGIVDETTSEVMRITTANNVGIATTSPAEKLDVNGRIRVQTVDSSGTAPHALYVNSVGTITRGAFPAAGVTGSGTTNRSAKFTASGTIGNGGIVDEVTSEVVRITTANNVGIATTTPAEKLDVNGRIRVQQVDSSGTAPHVLFVNSVGTITKGAFPSGGGTVTSVATGFGIDGGTITSTGTLTADTVEMATRARVQKGIDSVGALARVTGSGTTNYVPLFTGSTALGNSSIYEASTEVLIGTTSDAGAFKLQISGVTYSSDGLRTGNPNGGTAATWKLGSRVASSVALDGTQYIEVDIGGTLYYLATVSFLAPKP